MLLAQYQPPYVKYKEISPCPIGYHCLDCQFFIVYYYLFLIILDVDIDFMTLKFEVYGYTQRHCERIRIEMRRGDKHDAFKMCINSMFQLEIGSHY
jgi:hypothetical protein